MDKQLIGLKLKEMRKNSGKNWKSILSELSEQYGIDVAQSTVYGYENGHASPDIDSFLALCVIYGCSDVLYEFGYTSVKHTHKLCVPEEIEVAEKYRSLPESSKDMIRGALGIEKRDPEQMKGIS